MAEKAQAYVGARTGEFAADMDRIAVIGAGQMGNGVAHVFAQAGFPVTMIDVAEAALEKGKNTIAKNLERQVKKGVLASGAPAELLSRSATSVELAAAAESDLIVEAATENIQLKFKIFS